MAFKIFKSDGYKLPDALEEEIEAIILDEARVPPIKVGGEVGKVTAHSMRSPTISAISFPQQICV